MATSWLKLSNEDSDSLVYEHELLVEGEYFKEDDDLEFSLNAESLNKIAASSKAMMQAGNRSPLVFGHKGQESLGVNLDFPVRKNSENKTALFVKTKFKNTEARDKALAEGVSAFIPPRFIDGKKRVFHRPIVHVAATPFPVIPGLKPWQSVEASYQADGKEFKFAFVGDDSVEGGSDPEVMGDYLTEFAEALELDISEMTTDDEKASAIKAAILELMGTEEPEEEESEIPDIAVDESPSIAASFIRREKKSREKILDSLVLSGHLKPHMRDAMHEHFIDDDSLISLSLARIAETENPKEDSFDFMVDFIRKSNKRGTKRNGRRTPDGVILSHTSNNSPLSDNAKRRRENAGQKVR